MVSSIIVESCIYDIPVNIIITPTQIIRISHDDNSSRSRKASSMSTAEEEGDSDSDKRGGIYWNLLSKQKLKQVKALQQLKNYLEEQNKKSQGIIHHYPHNWKIKISTIDEKLPMTANQYTNKYNKRKKTNACKP